MELTDLSMEVTLDILPHVFPRDLSLELQLTPQQILLICVRTTLSFHTTFALTAVIEQIRHRKWSQGEVPRNGFIFLLVVRLKLICCKKEDILRIFKVASEEKGLKDSSQSLIERTGLGNKNRCGKCLKFT